MSSRNPTVSSSTTFSKKIKKASPIVTETTLLISEAPDFLRSLNIMRAPVKPAENTLPCSKTETEEIIAAMKETLMASPAPTPVILPKKRKRPTYDFKQLAEKIAKHNHNEILDPKVEEVNDNTENTVPVPVPVVLKNKGKNLRNEVEVGLIKQNRLRRKREIPSKVPEKVQVTTKKAKIEVQEKSVKNVVETSVKKSQSQVKKKTKIPSKKTIDENFASKIQTRNRKKNFIEESLSNELPLEKEDKLVNNDESSSSFVDCESSQEISSSEVPQKKKPVKVNHFKPKARNRRKPGVFFGSRRRKRNLKTENKNQQPTSSKVDTQLSKTIPKSDHSDSSPPVSEQNEQVLKNNVEELEDITETDITTPKTPHELKESVQNDSKLEEIVKEENNVITAHSIDTTEMKDEEGDSESRWNSQTDSFFDLPPSVSLGSILTSVNQAS